MSPLERTSGQHSRWVSEDNQRSCGREEIGDPIDTRPSQHHSPVGRSTAGTIPSAEERTLAPASARATDQDREHLHQAIELMRKADVVEKTGGPFGCVIVRDGEVLSAAGNSVLRDNDPSAHAEVNAIRAAYKKVNAPNIDGATMFASCEPCPMCYTTAYWARVGKIYYAAAWSDYTDLFDDSKISQDMKKPYAKRAIPVEPLLRSEAQKVWEEFRKMSDRAKY